MAAATVFRRGVPWSLTAALAGVLLVGCADLGPISGGFDPPQPSGTTKPNRPPDDDEDPWGPFWSRVVKCDPTRSVKSDGPALIVRDPLILSSFTLERVLKQLISLSGATGLSPEQLLQRLFDTENTTASGVFADNAHCDSPGNSAFKNGAAIHCPRAEGSLAESAGLFVPEDPDYFVPVALVNRSDLTPSTLDTCGEYRIIFAKWSGRSDPNDRLFLIFEGSLNSPWIGDVMSCWPVAETWAAIEKETEPAKIIERLEALFFTGLPDFSPLVDPLNFGVLSTDDDFYGHSRGQVRVSQRMEDPWELREFHLLTAAPGDSGPKIFFAPVTVKNHPVAGLFNPTLQTPSAKEFRDSFVQSEVQNLAVPELAQLRMQIANKFNAGESALSGSAGADYAAQVMSGDSAPFMGAIEQFIGASAAGAACPEDDPLTAKDILHRATTQTCAGCHAPESFLGPERKIGCGLTWPSTLGGAHIDEKGSLSPALTEAFLPHRASVMTTFLQACDYKAIHGNLQPVPLPALPK
jgi:hypothetical protein